MSKLLTRFHLRRILCRLPKIAPSCGHRTFVTHVPLRNSDVRYSAKLATDYNVQEAAGRQQDTVVSNSIDSMLTRIDNEAKRSGRIRVSDVNEIFDRIVIDGAISSVQSLYLIRCCGEMMHDEIPSRRNELVDRIWNKLNELNVPMDASHYNSLLNVYIENEKPFSAGNFLASMEDKGIIPNRVTYQRLIQKYCNDCDLNGAMTILEHMKLNEMTINESVFNSLMKGYARSNDYENAKGVLELMKNSELVPNEETYAILAASYAEKGDLAKVWETLEEAKRNDLIVSHRTYLRMIYTLAVSGHGQLIDEYFRGISHIRISRQECVTVILDLINKGQTEVAYDLILYVYKTQDFLNAFILFVKRLISCDQPIDIIIKYCHDIREKHIMDHIFEVAGKHAVFCKKPEIALALYKEMHKSGIAIFANYLWSVFNIYRMQRNEDGIWAAVRTMGEVGLPCDYDTYFSFVLPNVSFNDVEDIIAKVKENCQSESSVLDPLFFHCCKTRNYKGAYQLTQNYDIDINPRYVFRQLIVSYNPSNADNTSFLKLLQVVGQLAEHKAENEFSRDVYGRFFFNLLNENKLSKSLLTEASQMGFEISRSTSDLICEKIGRNDADALQLVRSLLFGAPVSHYRELNPMRFDLNGLSVEALEEQLKICKEKGISTRGILKHLLTFYCKNRNVSRMLETKREMENENFVFTAAHYAMMINLLVTNNNLEDAEKFRIEMNEQIPGAKLDTIKSLEYISLMVRSNKLSEAKDLLKGEFLILNHLGSDELLLKSVRRLLSLSADTGDADFTNYVFNYCITKLNLPLHISLFEPLVKVYVVKDDLNKAIETFSSIANDHQFLPFRNTLLKKCIAKNDPTRLQNVVDISTTYGGKVETLHELAVAFVETNHVKQAHNVMQTLGNKAQIRFLDDACIRFFQLNKIAELETMVSITKNITHINRDKLYHHLLQSYVVNNDYEKALEAWNNMQEDNVHPSSENLLLLANLLEKNHQCVPFIVPSIQEQPPLDGQTNLQNEEELYATIDVNAELQKHMLANNVDATVDFLRNLKKGYVRSIHLSNLVYMVEFLANKGCLNEISDLTFVMSYVLEKSRQVFMPIVEKYSKDGNVAGLKMVYSFLPGFTIKNLNFNYFFNHAYIVAEKAEELLDELERNVGNTKLQLFSSGGLHELLRNSPHLKERVKVLVNRYAKEEKFDLPLRALWLHHFTNEEYDEASTIFRENTSLFTAMDYLVIQIIKAIKQNDNISLATKFIEFVEKYEAKGNLKGKAYNTLFEILVKQDKIDEAVVLINQALKSKLTLNVFNPSVLNYMKDSFEQKNQKFPFDMGDNEEGSSSSSSSSSESEDKK